MSQILLIGGSRDGEIKEGNFEVDGRLNVFHTVVTSNRSPSNAGISPTETYVMDMVTIDGQRYAYATCRSIQGFEVIDLIKASSLEPLK